MGKERMYACACNRSEREHTVRWKEGRTYLIAAYPSYYPLLRRTCESGGFNRAKVRGGTLGLPKTSRILFSWSTARRMSADWVRETTSERTVAVRRHKV